ncbi:MAG: hypothetical protein WDN28_00630 [Chthoniobacter sp.]
MFRDIFGDDNEPILRATKSKPYRKGPRCGRRPALATEWGIVTSAARPEYLRTFRRICVICIFRTVRKSCESPDFWAGKGACEKIHKVLATSCNALFYLPGNA